MKKEINILRLFLLGVVIFAVIASIFTFTHLRKRVDYNKLTEVSISYANGMSMVYNSYTITQKDGQWIATQSFFGEDDVCKVVDDTFATKIKDILEENKAHKWNDFNIKYEIKKALSTISTDGTDYYFHMYFSDGNTIKIEEYNLYPETYRTVFEGFEKLYEQLPNNE